MLRENLKKMAYIQYPYWDLHLLSKSEVWIR